MRSPPPSLVVDFDMYDVPGADEDPHLAYLDLQKRAPDIFWTPHNGGHWVVSRMEDARVVHNDHHRFSREPAVSIPPFYDIPRSYPAQVDPPAHRTYREPLVRIFQPANMDRLEASVRATARELIQGFKNRGSCEFVADFAELFPITVFLDLVELPQSDRDFLREYACKVTRGQTPEEKGAANLATVEYLRPWVEARRACPAGDPISRMVNVQIDGERIPLADSLGYTVTLLLGGLDTVTAMLSFIIRYLAMNPGHQRLFRERAGDPRFVRHAVEELLRRHGIVNSVRTATHDFIFQGVSFRKGDLIMVSDILTGLDDRHFADPLEVDFDREPAPLNTVFGLGPHTCVGAPLARRETRIFLEEWFAAIPDFSIRPATAPKFELGLVNAVRELELTW